MSQGLIHILILANDVHQIDLDIIDLVVEQIVEIGRVQDVLAVKETLLDAGLESADALRLQAGIGEAERGTSKGLLQARLLEPGGVGKAQAGAGKDFAAAQRLQSKGDPWHPGVAEGAIVHEASAGNG